MNDRSSHPSADPAAAPAGQGRRSARRDWSARTRDTALDSHQYTRFVSLMKRALPIAASVLIAAVLIFSFIPRQSDKITMAYKQLDRIDNDLSMIRPRLSGTDAKGNPFVVTADVAVQDAKNTKRARLKNIEADMSVDRQRWINASAAGGLFDLTAGSLALMGGISVYSDSGYELHTKDGSVDLRSGVFHGRNEVTGQGPMGNFRADRFELRRATRQIFLDGNVRMTMYLQNSKEVK
jgi:lipopolysaccharide export system protein LptC